MKGGAALFGAALLVISGSAGAEGIPSPLVPGTPDFENGRKIVADRRKGLCLLCHSGPFPEERFQGNLAPSLAGAGSRNSEAMMRARIVNSRAINPVSLMPAYFHAEGLNRVGEAWQGRTILTPNEVEDVVAFLMTLKE